MSPSDWSSFWSLNGRIYHFGNLYYWFFFYLPFLRSFKRSGISILELGGGTGSVSCKLAKKFSGNVTIIDFCPKAAGISKKFFERNNCRMKYICEDIMKVRTSKKYDFVHSEGLVEHFFDDEREKCFQRHLLFLKKGGRAVIIAPNKSLIYPIRRLILKLMSPNIGEKPFSKNELSDLAKKFSGFRIVDVISNPLDVGVCVERIK